MRSSITAVESVPMPAWDEHDKNRFPKLDLNDTSRLLGNLNLDTEHLLRVRQSSEDMVKHHEQVATLLDSCISHNMWLLGQLGHSVQTQLPHSGGQIAAGAYAKPVRSSGIMVPLTPDEEMATSVLMTPISDGANEEEKAKRPGMVKRTVTLDEATQPNTVPESRPPSFPNPPEETVKPFHVRDEEEWITAGTTTNVIDDEEHHLRMRAKMAASVRRTATQSLQLGNAEKEDELAGFAKFRSRVGELVSNMYFDLAISVVVISNLVFVAVQVEYTVQHPDDKTPAIMYAVEYVYTSIFVAELSMRLVFEGGSFVFGQQWRWNLIDTIIVLFSLVEFLLDMVSFGSTSGDSNNSASGNFSYLRIIRVARTLRVIRVAKIMRFFRALRILIYSILSTLRSLMWTLLLLIIIIYAFGIIFCSAGSDYLHSRKPEDVATGNEQFLNDFFGSLPRSIFTLFKAVTGGIDWHIVAFALSDVGWFAVLLFVAYISFTYFAVMNVVTGVFCQSALESAVHDRDMLVQAQLTEREQYITRAQELFKDIDDSHMGILTLHEFELRLKDEATQAYFAYLELDVNDAWTLFKLIDVNEVCEVSIEDFVMGCLRLKGSAKTIDIATIMYQNQKILSKLAKIVDPVAGTTARSSGVLTDARPSWLKKGASMCD